MSFCFGPRPLLMLLIAVSSCSAAFAPPSLLQAVRGAVHAQADPATPLPSLRMPMDKRALHRNQRPSRAHGGMEAFSFDPFDRDVFRILMDAQSEARVLGAPAVGTQHLLLAGRSPRQLARGSASSALAREDFFDGRGAEEAGHGVAAVAEVRPRGVVGPLRGPPQRRRVGTHELTERGACGPTTETNC